MQIVTDWADAVACTALLLSPPEESQISLSIEERRGGSDALKSRDFKRKWGIFLLISPVQRDSWHKNIATEFVSADVSNSLQIQASIFCVNSTMVKFP